MKKRIAILIITLALIISVIPSALASDTPLAGVVTGSAVNVRSSPSLSAAVLNVAYKGETVEVFDRTGEWYKVNYKGITGYMHIDYIQVEDWPEANTIQKQDESVVIYGIVNVDALNFRTGPTTDHKIIKVLYKSMTFKILSEEDNGWYKVYFDLTEGYVCGDYITVLSESESKELHNRLGSATGQKIVDYASTFLGVKYIWGGETPSGFDCSGLVQYVFRNFGIYLPRTATEQSYYGVRVEKANLKPGDLVFFKTPGYPRPVGHIGIYVGSNNFLHASTAGDYVKISSLNESYYKTNYLFATRLVN